MYNMWQNVELEEQKDKELTYLLLFLTAGELFDLYDADANSSHPIIKT